MAPSRLVLVVLLAMVVAVAVVDAHGSGLIYGKRVRGDRLLKHKYVNVPYKYFRIVKEIQTYSSGDASKITQIRLIDGDKKDNGATVSILNGGPGQSFVTVGYKSKRGHGISYAVEIYGI